MKSRTKYRCKSCKEYKPRKKFEVLGMRELNKNGGSKYTRFGVCRACFQEKKPSLDNI